MVSTKKIKSICGQYTELTGNPRTLKIFCDSGTLHLRRTSRDGTDSFTWSEKKFNYEDIINTYLERQKNSDWEFIPEFPKEDSAESLIIYKWLKN